MPDLLTFQRDDWVWVLLCDFVALAKFAAWILAPGPEQSILVSRDSKRSAYADIDYVGVNDHFRFVKCAEYASSPEEQGSQLIYSCGVVVAADLSDTADIYLLWLPSLFWLRANTQLAKLVIPKTVDLPPRREHLAMNQAAHNWHALNHQHDLGFFWRLCLVTKLPVIIAARRINCTAFTQVKGMFAARGKLLNFNAVLNKTHNCGRSFRLRAAKLALVTPSPTEHNARVPSHSKRMVKSASDLLNFVRL